MGTTEILILSLVVVAGYFIPLIVALVRRKTGRMQVFIVNLFFGWTFIGWVIALVMAFGSDSVTVVHTVDQGTRSETKDGE